MPKDEFDFDDPMELSGVALLTEADTTGDMADCFIEEFLRMGYNSKQVLALFRNPHYLGPNMVLQKRGEQFVRERIQEVFAIWGRPQQFPERKGQTPQMVRLSEPAQVSGFDSSLTDPTGGAIPKINL